MSEDLSQYRTQAKDLLKQVRLFDPNALDRVKQHHPEGALSNSRLADCQLVVARERGYPSWTGLKHDVLFLNAVAALDAGDTRALGELVTKHTFLVGHHRHYGEWYESGYFAGATLLHHVAGNPIRCPLPANIAEVAGVLLDRGADPNAKTDQGSTTIGLLLTSMQASEAGVALPLMDLLKSAGADDDFSGGEMLTMSLLDCAPATAAALVERGMQMDIRHVAGLGRLDDLAALLEARRDTPLLEEALVFACIRGQSGAAEMLVRHGARGDVLLSPGGRTPRTALHEAANRGHADVVRLLLESGADVTVVEPHFSGTPAGWAEHGGHVELAALLRRNAQTA